MKNTPGFPTKRSSSAIEESKAANKFCEATKVREVCVGHLCPKCESSYLSTVDRRKMIISCDKCGWKGPFSSLKKQMVQIDGNKVTYKAMEESQ